MDLGLKGKTALITGGSHGIGRMIALALAEEGCNISICARGREGLLNMHRELDCYKIEHIGWMADVVKQEDVKRVVNATAGEFGTIHILVNNVGGGGRWGSEVVEETPDDIWLDVYNKNAMAAIRFTMATIPYMKEQKWGRVITIASTCGLDGSGRPWYSVAKSAEIMLMKSLAKSYTDYGITFNSVAPDGIRIPDKENAEGRLGEPEDVAGIVAFLASDLANYINGACIVVDGGKLDN